MTDILWHLATFMVGFSTGGVVLLTMYTNDSDKGNR